MIVPLRLTPERLSLFGLLLSILGTAFLNSLLSNLITQPNRPHNRERLTSEFLARHQLGYVSFYFSLLVVFRPEKGEEWLLRAIHLLVILNFVSFALGLRQTMEHDRIIRTHHTCPGAGCPVVLPRSVQWQIVRLNLVLGLLSFLLATLLIL